MTHHAIPSPYLGLTLRFISDSVKGKSAFQNKFPGHIHEQLQILVNMAILRTKVNPIMENKTRNFEQKLAKIAKAGAANTPHPLENI